VSGRQFGGKADTECSKNAGEPSDGNLCSLSRPTRAVKSPLPVMTQDMRSSNDVAVAQVLVSPGSFPTCQKLGSTVELDGAPRGR
jgi:hypothetical protein